MHSTVSSTEFARLLERWSAHQDLRRTGADVSELALSRWELEAARNAAR